MSVVLLLQSGLAGCLLVFLCESCFSKNFDFLLVCRPVTFEFFPLLLIVARECAGMNPCKRKLRNFFSSLHSNAGKFCFLYGGDGVARLARLHRLDRELRLNPEGPPKGLFSYFAVFSIFHLEIFDFAGSH